MEVDIDFNLSKPRRAQAKQEKNEAAMRDAIALLISEGIHFTRPDRYTLQFGPYSYWPGTQKLYRQDEERSLKSQGLAEITDLVRSLKSLPKASTRPAPKASGTIVHLDSTNFHRPVPSKTGPTAVTEAKLPERSYSALYQTDLQLRDRATTMSSSTYGRFVEFERTPETQVLESDIAEINEFLSTIAITGGDFGRLYRLFNNGDTPGFRWDKGGRLYSRSEKNYQSLPRAKRLRMTLNNELVCEIDIQASYLTILHGWYDAPFNPGEDPYALADLGREARNIVKDWFIITFGSPGHFAHWPTQIRNKYHVSDLDLDRHYSVKAIRQKAIAKYPILSQWDTPDSPRWPDLMYRESKAIIATMLELLRLHKAPSLPVHDSLVVPLSQRSFAEVILKRNFLTACHIEPKLTAHRTA